ncbi:hypothetical protein B0T24DRAFT_621143 [Lasiosphaeria ovina]|uniref:Uncharacterized protein n=1 Tax=Lasiosphaeria ovina TaxID=92902 RepID=A0AAE0KIQ4_9PEZI|nr:hypothetical protein B0T24DRAFT_621143 [Lasiosphaeria ovina]
MTRSLSRKDPHPRPNKYACIAWAGQLNGGCPFGVIPEITDCDMFYLSSRGILGASIMVKNSGWSAIYYCSVCTYMTQHSSVIIVVIGRNLVSFGVIDFILISCNFNVLATGAMQFHLISLYPRIYQGMIPYPK